MADQTNCNKCGQPILSGSMTIWLFGRRQCLCTRTSEIDANNPVTEFCRTCGKPLATSKQGSLTQWIFRSDHCQCGKKAVGRLHAHPKAGTAEHRSEEEQTQPADEQLIRPEVNDIELELALEENTFPLQRYKPLQLLGNGASGSVYLCRDRLLFKKVAVKTLHSASSEALIDFQNEAKITARLQHPGIVQILDFGIVAECVPFMVMQYLSGKTLKLRVQDEGPLEPNDVVQIFLKVSDALEYAHQLGVYHRDLQSANII